MRCKMILTATLVASLLAFAPFSAAQRPAQPPPAEDQQPVSPAVPGQRAMGPGDVAAARMQVMRRMSVRSDDAGGFGPGPGGLFQRVFRLQAALDDPQFRTALGLTDQEADSLRKIILDTETFTITTGADIAVNSIELRELLRADKPDRAAVMSKGDQISKSTSLLINHYLDAMLAAKTLLTPEQQKMLRAYMERGAPAMPARSARPQ